MSEEILDIVDEMDLVIGSATRGEVHSSGLLHRSAHLLVFDGNGMVMLQKRSMVKDTFPGTWDSSVSGHVDSGEEYDDCIIRETMEEIGFSLSMVPEKMFKIDACEETGNEFSWVYRIFCKGPFMPNEEEISELKWFSFNDVNRALSANSEFFSPAFSLIWKIMQDNRHLESS